MNQEKSNGKEESTNTPILIKTYGEFWSPEVVNWDRPGMLWGRRRTGPIINVWDERGVYVLYKDFNTVYVGRADKQSIGHRLSLHKRSQRKGPRWDRFSWFGIRGLNSKNRLKNLKASAHSASSELIATLEALLIMVIDPRLNARKEKFKNAIQLYQSDHGKPKDVQDQLTDIESKLNQLLSNKGSKTPRSRKK